MINVTIWNENLHEQFSEEVRRIYPDGIHGCIADFLCKNDDIRVHLATFDEAEHGLSREILEETDVLIYWSHLAQEDFDDIVAERIRQAVNDGMGLIALHSAHASKMMKKLLGTSMSLKWRHGDRERIFVTAPSHPIAQYIPDYIELPVEEMYGEYFDIPKPDDVIFTGWFAGGEVFRSGVTFTRGYGRIFYFQPGHETYPTYHDRYIQRIITNAVYWCAPAKRLKNPLTCREMRVPPEEISGYAAAAKRADKANKIREEDPVNRTAEGEGSWGNETKRQIKSAGYENPDRESKKTEQDRKDSIRLSVFYEHLKEAAEQTGENLEELLREAKKAGISGVEMEFSTLIDRPELNRIIRDAGMEISNLYQFFDFGNRFAAGMHTGRKMIDTASNMGIGRVMIIPGFLSEEDGKRLRRSSGSYEETANFMESLPEILSMKEALAELTEYAAERGIEVSMEDFDSFDSPISGMYHLKWFMEQVPGLRHTFDMGNYAFCNEDVRQAYELLENHICHVHCKDRGAEEEEEDIIRDALGISPEEKLLYRLGMKAVPVGEGYLPIAELVERLRKRDYRGYLAIEHFGSPDQKDYMLKSAAFLRGLLDR